MSGELRVVLDSNVWISGYFWKGKESELVLRCSAGEIISIISPMILDEVRRNLVDRFGLDPSMAEEYIEAMNSSSIITHPTGTIEIIKEDPSDNVIIETAVVGNAALIITGDRHLLKLKEYGEIRLIQARELIWMLESDEKKGR